LDKRNKTGKRWPTKKTTKGTEGGWDMEEKGKNTIDDSCPGKTGSKKKGDGGKNGQAWQCKGESCGQYTLARRKTKKQLKARRERVTGS